MIGRRRPVALLAAAVVVVAGTVAVVALASGSSGSVHHSAANAAAAGKPIAGEEPGSTRERGPARADARKRLRAFVPPPRSRVVKSLPRSMTLDAPAMTIESPDFIDLGRLWVTPESPRRVRAFLAAHAPPGTEPSVSWGKFGSAGFEAYESPELPGVADERELLVALAPGPAAAPAFASTPRRSGRNRSRRRPSPKPRPRSGSKKPSVTAAAG